MRAGMRVFLNGSGYSKLVNLRRSALHPLIVILGPTGSGKSALALEIAGRWNGEIVNCDSVQVYRGFDIGSAKTPPETRRGIPHHLLDVAGPEDEFTAGDYSRLARKTLGAISSARKLAVVCGGTGFYLRALLIGLSSAAHRHHRLRYRLAAIARRRPSSLHRLLSQADSAAAARIHPNDHQKLIRALEMARLAGTTTSQIQSRPREALQGFKVLKLGLNPDRGRLYDALNARTTTMFEHGLIEETKSLLEAGYAADSKPMQSLGYRQALAVISGETGLDQAVEDCRIKTRQYAKRQMTWFRAEPDVHWMDGFGADPEVQTRAFALVGNFLSQCPAEVL
jgi:tRNA dimethylallyltransferase